jgi:hypothetical protein
MTASPALDPERARLRRIGMLAVGGFVAVLVIVTVVLASGGDSRESTVVDGRQVDTGTLSDGDLVQVTGTVRNVFTAGARDNTSGSRAVVAERLRTVTRTDAPGLTPIADATDDRNDGRRITILGEVTDRSGTSRNILTVAEPGG